MAQHNINYTVIKRIIHSVGRIPAFFRFVFLYITKKGGLRTFAARIFQVLKNEGIKGFGLKLIYLSNQAFSGNLSSLNFLGYEAWHKKYYSVSLDDKFVMAGRINSFHIKPLISVLIPTYNSNPKWLKEAIESVKNQMYTNWEICIADDASTQQETLDLLHYYRETDARIKVRFRKVNGHISEASNTALEMADGDFAALLDHDDLLTEDALFWVVEKINSNPGAALIYSDEDKMDKSDRISNPYFKCNWNYHLFLSQNMISHLGVYKTSIVKNSGGFRKGFEGSQDYDLALRFIEQIDESRIEHIPRVLYHWRIHQQSTAAVPSKKPYAALAAQRAIADHLERKKLKAKVEILPVQYYRVKYELPAAEPEVRIILPTRNNGNLLEKCISGILNKTGYSNFEVVVVNNNSDDTQTINYLQELKNNTEVKVLDDNCEFNFSAINNRAALNTTAKYILFLNDDTEIIHPDWLTEMVGLAEQERVGVVGARLLYPDNTLQHAGIILGINGVAGHAHKRFSKSNYGYFGRAGLTQEFSAVTGACMLVKKELFDRVGGFDENLAIAYNDIDLCLKIKKQGYKIVWTPYAELYHHESKSRGADTPMGSRDRLKKESDYLLERWAGMIKNDPAYSPNLTLETENFGLAWPPRINSDVNDF